MSDAQFPRPLTPPYVRLRIRRFQSEKFCSTSSRSGKPVREYRRSVSGKPVSYGWRWRSPRRAVSGLSPASRAPCRARHHKKTGQLARSPSGRLFILLASLLVGGRIVIRRFGRHGFVLLRHSHTLLPVLLGNQVRKALTQNRHHSRQTYCHPTAYLILAARPGTDSVDKFKACVSMMQTRLELLCLAY